MSNFLRVTALSGLTRYGLETGAFLRNAHWLSAVPGPDAYIRSYATGASSSADTAGRSPTDEAEDVASIERYRASKQFRRRADGRVLLYGKEYGAWMEAKLDGFVDGSVLLLGKEGLVYYMVSEDLKQIDLSNDQLVGRLFGDGAWERIMLPLYTQTPAGELKHVKMTPQQFRAIFTTLKEAPPSPPPASASSGSAPS